MLSIIKIFFVKSVLSTRNYYFALGFYWKHCKIDNKRTRNVPRFLFPFKFPSLGLDITQSLHQFSSLAYTVVQSSQLPRFVYGKATSFTKLSRSNHLIQMFAQPIVTGRFVQSNGSLCIGARKSGRSPAEESHGRSSVKRGGLRTTTPDALHGRLVYITPDYTVTKLRTKFSSGFTSTRRNFPVASPMRRSFVVSPPLY